MHPVSRPVRDGGFPALPPEGVHVWHANLDACMDSPHRFEATLAGDELERAARFRYPIHRNRYVAGRAILRLLLGRYLGCGPGEISFVYGQCGKPSLAEPASASFRFNASHSGPQAAYAFAHGRELGIDIEAVRDRKGLLDIATHFFASGEVAALRLVVPEQQREAFYACWTRKEAYLKAKGDGLSLALSQFEMALTPGSPAKLLHAEGEPDEPEHWEVVPLDLVEGYAAALVIEAPCGPIAEFEWIESDALFG